MRTNNLIENPPEFDAVPDWMTLISRSEQGGRDYVPVVEGQLPEDLRGSLFVVAIGGGDDEKRKESAAALLIIIIIIIIKEQPRHYGRLVHRLL